MDWLGTQESAPQGSQLWKIWRGKGLGSSDAPTLLGVSPWKNLYELWLEKTDQTPEEKKFKGNWATQRGNDLEPIARDLYNKKFNADMYVAQAEHIENKIFRASFDGISHTLKKVIEIKCPGKVDHQSALQGEVPEKYIPQCQWLLMVAGYEDLDYVSYDGQSDIVVVPVKSDPVMQAALKEKAIWFWDLVTRRVPPPTDQIQVEDAELLAQLQEREALKNQITEFTLRFEDLNLKIKSKVKSNKMICGSYEIQIIEVKGQVDYAKIPEIQGISLDVYRKPPSRQMRIKSVQ